MKIDKKTFNKADMGMTIFLVLGILAVLNFFSYRIFHRFDLTKNSDYSISSVSKNAVGKLDDVVNIKVYFSKDLPSQYINLRQEVADILEEYQTYSHGNINVEFIDPKNDDETAQELYTKGIPILQFNVMEKDKYQVVKGYLGMIVSQGEKSEPIPVIQDTQNLEYQVTMAIKKVTSKEMAVVGFVSSNGTTDTAKAMTQAYQKISELYEVQTIDLTKEKQIDEKIKTLVIVGPKQKFTDPELKMIDAFVMRGGSLMVLADEITVGDGLQVSENQTGLEKLLEKYGIKINKDLVLDESSGMAAFNQGFVTFSTNYPFWPKVSKTGFDKDNAAVAKLESLVLPWASSLEIDKSKVDNAKISYLAQTTNKAWHLTDNFNLNPQQAFRGMSNTRSQYTLAASIIGKFTSPYSNKKSDNQSRIIVVGDANFIEDNFLRNYPDNLIFFQNTVDSLSLDEDLINIRSKGVSELPLKELSDSTRAAIRYANIFGVTIIVFAFGMLRYYSRRRSRLADEL